MIWLHWVHFVTWGYFLPGVQNYENYKNPNPAMASRVFAAQTQATDDNFLVQGNSSKNVCIRWICFKDKKYFQVKVWDPGLKKRASTFWSVTKF